MTIDEAIIRAKLLKDELGKDAYKYEILTSLIDVAEKYQKIEGLYKKYQNDVVTNIYADKKLVKALEEVFEDEQTNRCR